MDCGPCECPDGELRTPPGFCGPEDEIPPDVCACERVCEPQPDVCVDCFPCRCADGTDRGDGFCGPIDQIPSDLCECERICADHGGAGACGLPIEVGPCDAAIPRWAFDVATGQCVQFVYGGCEGNANNFETEDACALACER